MRQHQQNRHNIPQELQMMADAPLEEYLEWEASCYAMDPWWPANEQECTRHPVDSEAGRLMLEFLGLPTN